MKIITTMNLSRIDGLSWRSIKWIRENLFARNDPDTDPEHNVCFDIYHVGDGVLWEAIINDDLTNEKLKSELTNLAYTVDVEGTDWIEIADNVLTLPDNPTPEDLSELWGLLGNVPVNNDGEIENRFFEYPAGTHREEIWQWFDQHHPEGVVKLMYG